MECLDAPLYKTLSELPAFPFSRLVRPDAASTTLSRRAFSEHRHAPAFTYSKADRFPVPQYLEALKAAEDRVASVPTLELVRGLYQEKIRELRTRAQMIEAMQHKDDEAVSSIADHLFGTPNFSTQELTDEFQDLLARAHELHVHEDRIDAPLFTRMVRDALDYYGMTTWTIRESVRPSVSISHGKTSTIRIPKSFIASRARAARVLTHEIEVHALRSHNGTSSSLQLLGHGFAGYIATDEGLAVAMQQRLRTEESRDPGFWDAWTASLTRTCGFLETFDTIFHARLKLNIAMNKPDAQKEAHRTAWRLMLRVSRGLHTPGKPGLGYRRDHLYRTGLAQVRNALNAGGQEILPTLFAGHAGVQHIPALQQLGIIGRTPDFISEDVVKTVLRSTKKPRA